MLARESQVPATLAVARAVCSSRFADLSEPVARQALRTFVNFVGCALGGAQHPAVELVRTTMTPSMQGGKSTVLGHSRLTALGEAALLNGMAGAVNAFDDTHAAAVVHPGSPVGAALVALASSMDVPVSGEQFLNAYAWGIELTCRVSMAVSVPPAQTTVAWSQSGVAAPIGAAAACARLLDLDEARTAWAIGIAATLSSGLRVANGTMAMHLVPARAAVTGVEAALLARAGVTGPDQALEGRHGFLEAFARKASLEHLVEGLGTRFELLANTFKPYPCGIVIHPVIDACLALSVTEGLTASSVEALTLEVPPIAIALTDLPHPTDTFGAQVSAQHWAAVALLRGEAGLEQGTAREIANCEVRVVRDKCKLVAREGLSSDAAVVKLLMRGGIRREVRIAHCLGSQANPLSDDALSQKFLLQGAPLVGAAEATSLLRQCWALSPMTDVRHMWRVSRPAPTSLAGD